MCKSVFTTWWILLAVFPSVARAGPLLDAVGLAPGPAGPATNAIMLSVQSDNVDTFAVETVGGDPVCVRLEQPRLRKIAPVKRLDLSSGRTLGPCLGCGSPSCAMCVLNSLALHGQSYAYLRTLGHTERMRLHYRLHKERGFDGVRGETQTIRGPPGGSRVRRIFRNRRR